MLQALREKTSGWLAFVILAAVTIPFAFFGINNYFETRVENFVAKVGKKEISPRDFQERLERIRAQQRAERGDAFDPSVLNQPEIKRQILERLIDEEVLIQVAQQTGAEVSAERLRKEIAKIPAFQTDGKFDANQYRILLAGQQMTPRGFEEQMRRDMSLQELPAQVGATSVVTDADIDRYLKLRDQLRDFRYVLVPAEQPKADAVPTDAEIQAYYDAHKDEFMTPELVAIEYVEIDGSKLPVAAAPDEAALKQKYEDEKARFVTSEQRLASHVLVRVEPTADADAQKAAQEKAAKIAADARGGKDFAELAKELSDDVGSKAQGGDLGWIERGVTNAAFEEALFAQEVGKVSDPVRSDEGWHVILVREIQPERVKTFEEVRADLEREMIQTARDDAYAEVSTKFTDVLFLDQSVLEPAAKAIDAEVKRTGLFGREGGTEGLAADPRVVQAAFSEPVLVEGSVSDPIDLGPNHVVAIRVDEHQPRKPKPLEDVRTEIVTRLNVEAAKKATTEKAEALFARLNAGEPLDTLAKEIGGTVVDATGIGRAGLNHDPQLVSAVFKLPRGTPEAPQRARVAVSAGNHALVELTKVTDGDPKAADPAARDSVRQLLTQGHGQVETRALLDALRAAIKIEIAEERL